MKRVCIFMIVLVLCVNVSLIASGGKEAVSEGPITIQYWHYQPTPIKKEIEAGNIKLFEERNPGITVEYVPVPWEKAHAKYITSIAAGNAADVGMVPDFWISEFASMGALENLEPFIAQWEHKDDFIPLALSSARLFNQRGPVQAVGWFADLYRKHHVTPPTAPTDVYKQMVGAFGSGVTAMYVHNNGSISDQLKDLGEGKFMTTPIPIGPDGYRCSKNMSSGYGMFTQSKKKDAAWKFLGHQGGPIGNNFRSSKVGSLPVNRTVYDQEWLKSNRYSKAFEKQLLGEQSEQEMGDHIAAKLTEAQQKWLKRLNK